MIISLERTGRDINGSIKCIPKGPPRVGDDFFVRNPLPSGTNYILSNFPRGRSGTMDRLSFHAKVLVLFIKNGRLPLQLIKKNTEKTRVTCSLQLVKKKINHYTTRTFFHE